MSGRYLSSQPDTDVRSLSYPISPAGVSTGTNLPSLHPHKAAARAGGWRDLFSRHPHIPKSFYCPAHSPRPHLRQRQPGLNSASASSPRPRIFLPLHFCPRAFSLCEGLSTAFLSNSQRGGRFSCEPELHGTVASRGREEDFCGLDSCQPWAACARKSLHWSSGHSELQPHGKA